MGRAGTFVVMAEVPAFITASLSLPLPRRGAAAAYTRIFLFILLHCQASAFNNIILYET